MSKINKNSFTLIELIIVVILIGIVYFIVLNNYSLKSHPILKIDNLYYQLPKDCNFIVFKDHTNIETISNKNYNFNIKNPIVYQIINNKLVKVNFDSYKHKNIIFQYKKYNNIQNSYILYANEKYFVFTPFDIKKTNSLNEAKNLFLNKNYLPKDGEYYK